MRINRNFIAACMLAAFSIAAVEEPWAKLAQAGSPAIIVGAEENQKKITEKSDSKFIMDKDLSEEMQKDLFAEYEKFGIYNKEGALYYNDKPVRCFVDTHKMIENKNQAGGKTITFSNICTYVDWDGAVDVYTIRKETAKTAESSKVLGDIESVQRALAIEDMVPFVSAQSLAKIVETVYAEGGISAVYKIVPYISQEAISSVARNAAANGDYRTLKDIVQFLSEDTVTEIVNSEYEKAGISNVHSLLLFMSQESLGELAQKAADKNDIESLAQMAFCVNVRYLDKIVLQLECKGKHIAGIAPFISGEALEDVVKSEYKNGGASAIYELLPIMPKEMVNKYIQKAAKKKDYKGVEKMAPYASKKVVKKIADKMRTEGRSIAKIMAFIK